MTKTPPAVPFPGRPSAVPSDAWQAGHDRGAHDATRMTNLGGPEGYSDRLRIGSGEMPGPDDMDEQGRMTFDNRVKWLNGYAAGIMEVTLPLALRQRLSEEDYLSGDGGEYALD